MLRHSGPSNTQASTKSTPTSSCVTTRPASANADVVAASPAFGYGHGIPHADPLAGVAASAPRVLAAFLDGWLPLDRGASSDRRIRPSDGSSRVRARTRCVG